jgi:hypothetical protein
LRRFVLDKRVRFFQSLTSLTDLVGRRTF